MWKGVHMNYTLTIDDVLNIIEKAEDSDIVIVRRHKNILFITDKKIAWSDARSFIRSLCRDDLIAGPIPDDDPSLKYPVWIFKKEGFGCVCYVKLKVIHKKVILVISLHEDERREA